ncbi:alpha/beta fold hydrolase [Patescibacteria group bacterium]|nr:MAG: alpha/beta fold hydrolase [Patescibacteria group bacterium]
MQMTEGYITHRGYRTYYVVYGELGPETTPVIGLHGGPGYTHHHLEPLKQLVDAGYSVVLYDQLGCGQSDRPDDPSLWTIQLFIDELTALREQLGITQYHLLGHSWGGSLAAEYALTRPEGLQKLILSSPLLDSHLWVAEANRLIDELPEWAAEQMKQHEAAGTTDSYEYGEAYAEFKRRHICRVVPYPNELVKSDQGMGAQVYNTMWGPSETCATGNLKDWSVMDKLHQITVPTLFISGKYDEATPLQTERAHQQIPGSEWVLLENSSHSALFEQPIDYLATLTDFLGDG